MKMPYNRPPAVIVEYRESLKGQAIINEILAGLEEEGIPYETVSKPIEDINIEDAVSLAYDTASSSALEVGIYIASDGTAVLHYAKLPSQSPLYQIGPKDITLDIARTVGINAGKLVKNLPFIAIE